MSRHRCECGRPALALIRVGKKRSRKARAVVPVAIPGHTLCPGCWRKHNDRLRGGR